MMKPGIIRNILLFFFCGLLLSVTVYSQTFPYYQYTKKDGLAHPLVWCIHQDKLGYIWIATADGLSRFDGNTFRNFTTADGLNSNYIRNIAESDDGTLYFASGNTKAKWITSYKGGKFSNYEVNPAPPYDVNSMTDISHMSMKNDTFYVIKRKGLSYIYNHNIYNYDPSFSDNHGSYEILPYKKSDSPNTVLLACAENGLYELDGNKYIKIQIEDLNESPVYSISVDKDNNLWLSSDGKIFKLRNYKTELSITVSENNKDKVSFGSQVLADSRGIVWFHTVDKGLCILRNNQISEIGSKTLIGKSHVEYIYEDREGNVWVSANGKGVFCFNNLSISNYYESDGLFSNRVRSVLAAGNGVKLIGTLGGLSILEKDKIEKIITEEKPSVRGYLASKIKAGLNGNYLICGTYNFPDIRQIFFNTNMVFLYGAISVCQPDPATLITSYPNPGSGVLSFNSFEQGKLVKKEEKFVINDSDQFSGIYEIEKANDGVLWLGTVRGLCKMDGDNKTFFKDDPVLSSRTYSIKIISNGNILVASEKGISVLIQNPEKILSLEKTDKFDFSKSRSVDIDNDNNIWIGNMKGLYRIPMDSFLNGKYNDIIYFNDKTGLPSYEVHTVSFDKMNNELWVGTEEGLAKMELNNLDKYLKPPPKVLVENVFLSDTNLTKFDNIVFKPYQNNLRVHFTAFNYSSPKSIKYEYMFEGEKDWTETVYSEIDFHSLSSGKYNLLLRAVNNTSLKGDISSLKFEILAPFWKTLWFYFLLILIFLAVVFFIYRIRMKRVKNKAAEQIKVQKSISDLKHQALSASLNPHFIFNALNSIQYYFNEHSKEEANKYLVNFSRLIRMNLDSAGNTFIPLSREIERLKLYMEYEKLRFEDKMNYRINIDEKINSDRLEIPNMILQPFVENSIWHGLLNRKGEGVIDININRKEKIISMLNYSVIEIEIIDNGIGLEESKKLKQSKHISKGISMIKERLNLLELGIKNFDFVTIKERIDGIQGVIVNIVLLPKHYNIM
ncbi:MAG: histidine kinase [Ignavibacteriae bacterium]|nr:histidine kinase [Ignavibacteriota bacterium]